MHCISLFFQNGMDNQYYVKVEDITSSSSSDNVSVTPVVCQTYWYRWYICIIFSLLGLFQGAIWNTWGPIDESAETAFGFMPSTFILNVV